MIARTDSPVSTPLPNFLIYSQDGEFTPYDERSVADPSEASEDHLVGQIMTGSLALEHPAPDLTSISNTTTARSRAASDALEKLLAIQARQISEIGQAWRAKYSLSPLMMAKSGSATPMGAASAIATLASSEAHQDRDLTSGIKVAGSFQSFSNHGSPRIEPSDKLSGATEGAKPGQGAQSGKMLSISSLQKRDGKGPSKTGDRVGISEWLQGLSDEKPESESLT